MPSSCIIILYYISIMSQISNNPKNTGQKWLPKTRSLDTVKLCCACTCLWFVIQISAVIKLRRTLLEEVVKNVNLLFQLVLGWQEAMLLELQQASVYNITDDWIWPHCKCLNLVLFFLTIRFVLQTLASSVLLLARKPQRKFWWDLLRSSCACI